MASSPETTGRALVIHEVNDEVVEYWLDGACLISTNHDDDGWSGMERVNTALTKMAAACGLPVQGSNEEDDHRGQQS